MARNRDPIRDGLAHWLPERGLVLEVASGTGEHATHFARTWPHLTFQPSDPNEEARASIDAWVAEAGLPNLRSALPLDAASDSWPLDEAAAILCVNMIHISPWAATLGLMRGAGRLLPPGGILYLYGPYRQAGVPTAPSNDAFDDSLRSRNPNWGLRDLDAVVGLAAAESLELAVVEQMPANNLSVIFRAILK